MDKIICRENLGWNKETQVEDNGKKRCWRFALDRATRHGERSVRRQVPVTLISRHRRRSGHIAGPSQAQMVVCGL